jgi:hypothetical protein
MPRISSLTSSYLDASLVVASERIPDSNGSFGSLMACAGSKVVRPHDKRWSLSLHTQSLMCLPWIGHTRDVSCALCARCRGKVPKQAPRFQFYQLYQLDMVPSIATTTAAAAAWHVPPNAPTTKADPDRVADDVVVIVGSCATLGKANLVLVGVAVGLLSC